MVETLSELLRRSVMTDRSSRDGRTGGDSPDGVNNSPVGGLEVDSLSELLRRSVMGSGGLRGATKPLWVLTRRRSVPRGCPTDPVVEEEGEDSWERRATRSRASRAPRETTGRGSEIDGGGGPKRGAGLWVWLPPKVPEGGGASSSLSESESSRMGGGSLSSSDGRGE